MSDETQLGENFYDVVDAPQPGDKTNGAADPILGKDFYADAPPVTKPVHKPPVIDEATAETVHPHFERARLMYGPQKKSGDESDDGTTEQSDDGATETDEKPESKVDLKIDLPEGYSVEEQHLEQFATLAGELNVSPEGQQQILDLYAAGVKREAEARESQRAQWEADTRADQELGHHLPSHLKRARSLLAEYGTPELAAILESSGLGSHPEVVRVFSRIAKDIKSLVGKL